AVLSLYKQYNNTLNSTYARPPKTRRIGDALGEIFLFFCLFVSRLTPQSIFLLFFYQVMITCHIAGGFRKPGATELPLRGGIFISIKKRSSLRSEIRAPLHGQKRKRDRSGGV